MHTTNSWNLFHILGTQAIRLTFFATLLVACTWNSSTAQNARDSYNFRDFQAKPYYFGITLAYNQSTFRPFRSKEFLATDSIRIVESLRGPGFNLGIVTNLKIGDYFDFRFLPTLSFAERNIQYNSNSRVTPFSQRKVESVFVELPFHVRYKSAVYRDIRLFVIAGVKYSFDVASDSRSRQADTLVKVSPTDFQLEYGAGMQFFFPYFIFSPEFKISQGIGNTLIFDPNLEESTILEKLLSRTFTISLHFEG